MAETPRYHSIDLTDLRFRDLEFTHGYWEERRAGRLAPAWKDIDLIALPPALVPRVCVVDVVTGPLDFLYRFWGTQITDMHRYDLTGRSVRLLTPQSYAETVFRQYAEVVESTEPRSFITEVPLADGRFTFYATIRLPLSSDGRTVDRVLSVEEYGEEKQHVWRVFERLGGETS